MCAGSVTACRNGAEGMRSLRAHLLAGVIGTVCITMLLAAWATYRLARQEANDLFDYQLQQIALSVRDQSFLDAAERLANDEDLDYVIRVWDRTGLIVYSSRRPLMAPELTRLGLSTVNGEDGPWRAFALQYRGLTISVAQPMRVRDRLAAAAAWRTLQPFVVILPVLALLIWALVHRGLQPLAHLAQALQARSPESLTPMQGVTVPEEVEPLLFALNDLLARMQQAQSMQRAFVADAAHELRSPLAALQLQLQLVERAANDATRTEAVAELKAGLQRATHTVHQMLTLARLEPGASERVCAPVSLADVARGAVLEYTPLADARDIDLGLAACDEAAVITGDADALRILLANLLGNALRHTPASGQVDVACGVSNGQTYLDVADSGPGIPPAERERVFDRFYRGATTDQAGAGGGSGLGLAIVRAIAERHGAQVRLDDAPLGGLRVRVTFPAKDLAAASA